MLAIAATAGSSVPVLIDELPIPALRAEEVLCRTLELGVCGTDREILESRNPLAPAGSDYLILGHECLGRVEEVGDLVETFKAGDLVVPVVRRSSIPTERVDMLPFGRYTERGIVHEHGFSSHWWTDHPRHLFHVPADIAQFAVLTEPMSVSEKGIHEALAAQTARQHGDTAEYQPRVLVTGMGPIGFAAVMACRCRGWHVTLYGRDQHDSFRAELAQRFGAKYRRNEQFHSPPHDVELDGYDLILECTGSDEVILETGQWLATCGIMVWLGSSRSPQANPRNLDLLIRNAVLRNHIYLGSVNAAPRDFAAALADLQTLQRETPAQLDSLITCQVEPQDALWHYEHRQPQGIKTVLKYGV